MQKLVTTFNHLSTQLYSFTKRSNMMFAGALTLMATLLANIGITFADTDFFDVASTASDNMWNSMNTLISGWAIGIFLVALIVFIFAKEKAKDYAKGVMIGCIVAYIAVNSKAMLTATLETINGWFNSTAQ